MHVIMHMHGFTAFQNSMIVVMEVDFSSLDLIVDVRVA